MFLGTFLTLTSGDITAMLGYVQNIITDLTPLMLPIIAAGVGIFIFWAIVKAIRP